MTIVKTDVPTTWALCDRTIDALLARYPIFSSQVLTATAFGRNVRTLVAGRGPRRVVFSAAHHANEWITAPVLLKFAEELGLAQAGGEAPEGMDADRLLRQATIHLVPMVDPDGVDLVTGAIAPDSGQYARARTLADNYPGIPFPQGWKADLQGVDLNLQYPAGWLQAREIKFSQGYTLPGPRDYVGRAPLLQPEARALAEYTAEVDPALVVALHTQGRVIYWQFGGEPVPGARARAEEFARVSGYALEDTPYASSFAGYKDWFIRFFRRPGFTVEAGLGENPLPIAQFDELYRACRSILLAASRPEEAP